MTADESAGDVSDGSALSETGREPHWGRARAIAVIAGTRSRFIEASHPLTVVGCRSRGRSLKFAFREDSRPSRGYLLSTRATEKQNVSVGVLKCETAQTIVVILQRLKKFNMT
jgi:hypothetical protein